MSFCSPSRSPTYDPSAASPCNPFPTISPFTVFTPRDIRDGLIFDMDMDSKSVPTPQPTQLASLERVAALARIPPPHSAPAMRRTKLCRFFLSSAGCKTGRWCNFKHPVGADAVPEHDASSCSRDALPSAVARPRRDSNDASMWDSIPDVRDLDPNWGKKSEDEVHPKFRTQPCRNFLLGLCRYGAQCLFIHAPGLFTGVGDVPTSLPVSGLQIPVSVWGPHPGIGVSLPESSPVEKRNQMSLHYRTKPCKFFSVDGACPHGEGCRFVHPPKKARAPSPLSWAEDNRELDLEESPRFDILCENTTDINRPAMHDMTNGGDSSRSRRRGSTRVDSSAENEREREGGLYKPLWRVVGGGVRVGKATDAQTHPEEAGEDDAVLEYQPRDSSRDYVPVLASVLPTMSPATDPWQQTQPISPLDLTYTPFDPAQYPPHALLLPPSPTDVPLDIVMGRLEGYGAGQGMASGRKRRVVTGADLIRGLGGGREKPRLTIAVPSAGEFERSPQQSLLTQTPSGDDLLDWGEGVDPEHDGAGLRMAGQEDKMGLRRVRSTPPTPRSSMSCLVVHALPRRSAESP